MLLTIFETRSKSGPRSLFVDLAAMIMGCQTGQLLLAPLSTIPTLYLHSSMIFALRGQNSVPPRHGYELLILKTSIVRHNSIDKLTIDDASNFPGPQNPTLPQNSSHHSRQLQKMPPPQTMPPRIKA